MTEVDVVQTFLDKLAEHGVVGLLLALALVWIFLKEKEIKEERIAQATAIAKLHEVHSAAIAEAHRLLALEKDARIGDSKGYTELALRIQGQVTTSVQQISEIYRALPAITGGRP